MDAAACAFLSVTNAPQLRTLPSITTLRRRLQMLGRSAFTARWQSGCACDSAFCNAVRLSVASRRYRGDTGRRAGNMQTAAAATSTSFAVAIDGPAASGKGTIAKSLAAELHLAHLDTGLLYRGVGHAAASAGVSFTDEDRLADLAANLDLNRLDDPALRLDTAAQAASKVSVYPKVRAALLDAQRRFAAAPPPQFAGAVLDGRDVGTVVLPHAQAKLFVTADATVRAQRRLSELQRRGLEASYDAVLADLRERDARDSSRAAAPMKAADDAEVLDTSDLDAAQAHAAALAFVRQRLEAWRHEHGQAAADSRVAQGVGVGSAV